MKRSVYELMEHYADSGAAPETGTQQVSAARIREMTMEKVRNETRKNRRGVRTLTRVLALAAAAAVLSLTVFAAVRHFRLQPVTEPVTAVYEDGSSYTYDDASALLTTQTGESAAHAIAFRTTWLPEGLGRLDTTGTVAEYASYLQFLGGDVSGLTLSEEEQQSWYTTVWSSDYDASNRDGDPFLRVDLFDGARANAMTFVVHGDYVQEGQGTVAGMDAMYLSNEQFGVEAHYLILYNEDLSCVVMVYGNLDYETLEHVAEGLEFIDTGLTTDQVFTGEELYSLGMGAG